MINRQPSHLTKKKLLKKYLSIMYNNFRTAKNTFKGHIPQRYTATDIQTDDHLQITSPQKSTFQEVRVCFK